MRRLLLAYLIGCERGRSQLGGGHTVRAAVLGALAIGVTVLFMALVPPPGPSSPAPSSVTTTAPASTTSAAGSVGTVR